MTFDRLDAITEFQKGTAQSWATNTNIIPENMIIFEVDTKIIRKGDGINAVANLPPWIDLANMPSGTEGSGEPYILGEPSNIVPSTYGDIVILDSNGRFFPSGIKLDDVIATLNSIDDPVTGINKNQDDAITSLLSYCDLLGDFNASDNGKICIVSNTGNGLKYIASDMTLAELNTQIENEASDALSFYVSNVKFYSDDMLVNEIGTLEEQSMYYAKIFAEDTNGNPITYSLVSDDPSIVINKIGGTNSSVFSFTIGQITSDSLLTFTATGNNSVITKAIDKAIQIKSFYYKVVELVYNTIDYEYELHSSVILPNGNIVSVGVIYTDVDSYGLIVKFDNNLNMINARYYDLGTGGSEFYSVIIDSVGNIIIVGKIVGTGLSPTSGVILKLDQDLNITNGKLHSDQAGDFLINFNNVITYTDNTDIFYVVVGYATNSSSNIDKGLLIRYSVDFTLATGDDVTISDVTDKSFKSITLDTSGNFVVIGDSGNNAIIMKFDKTNLSILNQTEFQGNSGTVSHFSDIVNDGLDNFYVVGDTLTSTNGAGLYDGLICKFDNSLSLISNMIKTFGGASYDYLRSIKMLPTGNFIISGISRSFHEINEYDGIFFEIGIDLSLVNQKTYGNRTEIYFDNLNIAPTGDFIICGYGTNQQNYEQGLLCKFSSDFPVGTFSGAIIDYEYSDCTLLSAIVDSNDFAIVTTTYTLSNLGSSIINCSTTTIPVSNIRDITETVS